MNTIDRAESSRRNGAKSQGPKTPEGKQRSSRNALKFGIHARRLPALSTEQQAELDQLRAAYYAEWQPADMRQCILVDKIVDAEWRYLRYSVLEKWAIEDCMVQMSDEVEHSYEGDPALDLRATLAVQRLYEKNRAFENLQRECHRLSRAIERFTRMLQDLQDKNPPAASDDSQNQNCENEPEAPESPHDENHENEPETAPERAQIWVPPIRIRRNSNSQPREVVLAMAS